MSKLLHLVLCILLSVIVSEPARILTVVPTPSISHQVVFRPLVQELAKRGHDVTFITTDPAFPEGKAPQNLTEIDLHDLSYEAWRKMVYHSEMTSGSKDEIVTQMRKLIPVQSQVFEKQLLSEKVQKIINSTNKPNFDLLIIEACSRFSVIYSHIFKNIPVISMSSFLGTNYNFDTIGAPTRPVLLYPSLLRQRLNNLSLWEKLKELHTHFLFEQLFSELVARDDEMLRRIFGEDTPSITELENNVDMLLLNVNPIWDQNRPVPPSVKYIGGLHTKISKELPKDLKSYLDSSKHGVIYISFGTNVSPSQLPPERIQILVNVFSRLPYDVLWKWDKDELPGRSKNIRISKWLPQSDLLQHPKVKLFVTQGGLQSTDEAITAGVPLIGMPMLGDQWYNVEQYLRHNIGLRLDLDELTEEQFLNGIHTIVKDDSYRKNVGKLRNLMRDAPESAMDRAVWWVEHLLRHGGGRHLRSPTANMSWAEYLDAELVGVIAAAGLVVLASLGLAFHQLLGFFRKNSQKLKIN